MKTITIKLYNGVIDDVVGLPDGSSYILIDEDEMLTEEIEEKIRKLKDKENTLILHMKGGVIFQPKFKQGYKIEIEEV